MSNLSRRDFTLVNHVLSLQVTVTAEWRDQAKMLAVAVANEQGYNVPDNHTAYWNPLRDYHDASKYTKI